mmetsp:Transcript_150136/g.273291  ORF Transcript_150136/g.273291 Transcript_150136/m.273291 type:complete len:368 (+) Transcript_150136:56-1159(+)
MYSTTTIRSFGEWELVLVDLGSGERAYVNKSTGVMVEDPPEEVLKIMEAENARSRRNVYEPTTFHFARLREPTQKHVKAEITPCICCDGSGKVPSYGACPLCEGSGVDASESSPGSKVGASSKPMEKIDLLGKADGSAFVLHNFLSPQECQNIIAQAEGFGFIGCGYNRRIRVTDRVSVMGHELAELLFARAKPYLSDVVALPLGEIRTSGIRRDAAPGLWKPVGINPCFRVCKYTPGGFFLPHHDGGFEEDDTTWSFKTFMMYLNDDFIGGPTNFYEESQPHYRAPDPAKIRYVFRPQLGSCLVFNHCYCHDGGELESGVKYLLRTEVMYKLQCADESSDSEDDAFMKANESSDSEDGNGIDLELV